MGFLCRESFSVITLKCSVAARLWFRFNQTHHASAATVRGKDWRSGVINVVLEFKALYRNHVKGEAFSHRLALVLYNHTGLLSFSVGNKYFARISCLKLLNISSGQTTMVFLLLWWVGGVQWIRKLCPHKHCGWACTLTLIQLHCVFKFDHLYL